MLWIEKLPLPPSANEMYETRAFRKKKISKKTGDIYTGIVTSKYKSDSLTIFQLQCKDFRNRNLSKVYQIREILMKWISQGFVLRVDSWFAFEHSRIWTKDGQPQVLDADNRRKALQDGLATILDIDDKWFFSGNVEKVTTTSKDYEQCLIRITPVKARTLQEIQNLKNEVGSIPHF